MLEYILKMLIENRRTIEDQQHRAIVLPPISLGSLQVNAVKNILDKYDWVLWSDCDALFMDPQRTLDSIIHMCSFASAQQREGAQPCEKIVEGVGRCK